MKVGFIGLGAMGMPIAKNLATAKFLHRIWNRTESKSEIFSQQTKVKIAITLKELAADCNVIFTSVSADNDLESVVKNLLPSLTNQHVIIDTSTVSMMTAKKINKLVRDKGAHFLDAPVSGGVEGAQSATLVMMIGGDEVVFQTVLPLLACISRKQVYLGESGSGQACKAVNQIMAAGINQAVSESLAFAQAINLDLDKVIEVTSSGAAANWFLTKRGPTMVKGVFEPGFKLALHHKDLKICREMIESVAADEIRLPLVEMSLIHYQRLMDQGLGDEDISVLFKLKQKLFFEH